MIEKVKAKKNTMDTRDKPYPLMHQHQIRKTMTF